MAKPGKRWKLGLGVLVGLALIGGVGWPIVFNFVNFGARARGAEARANLKKLCLSQQAVFKERQQFAVTYPELAQVEPGNRYAYFVAPGAVLEERPPPAIPNLDAIGVQVDRQKHPELSALTQADLPATFTGGLKLGSSGCLAAAGNIDADPALDVWSVATAERTSPDGKRIEPCEPFHERDDIGSAFGF
jgi:type IV pilus assembly protein PilA